jgi:hypothetical protein
MALTSAPGPTSLDRYMALCRVIFELSDDPAKEKSFQGRSYSIQDLGLLEQMKARARMEAESEGLLEVNLRSSFLRMTQMQPVDIRGYWR